jgi:hypothetical protein
VMQQRADFYDDSKVIHVTVDSEGRGTIADWKTHPMTASPSRTDSHNNLFF